MTVAAVIIVAVAIEWGLEGLFGSMFKLWVQFRVLGPLVLTLKVEGSGLIFWVKD